MSDDIEVRAKEMGWRPREEFNGDESKFVEAAEFVERGEKILPIVREHNKKLEQDVKALREQLERSTQLQQASADAIQALKESHEQDIQRQVEKTRKQLMEEIKAARQDGDVETEMSLRDRLDELPKGDAKPAADKPTQKAPEFTPEFLEWADKNSWYGTDMRRTSLADGIARELRANKANDNLKGIAFFNKVSEEVKAIMDPPARGDRVEGPRGGVGNSGGDGGKGYNALPPEAKAVCDKQAARLVGEGRAFKTQAEWRAHYAQQFFRGE